MSNLFAFSGSLFLSKHTRGTSQAVYGTGEYLWHSHSQEKKQEEMVWHDIATATERANENDQCLAFWFCL